MESAPTTDAVYQGVFTLYNNPNNTEKEEASKWLDLFQKSVSRKFAGCENCFLWFDECRSEKDEKKHNLKNY